MSSRNDHSVGYDHTLLSSVPDPTRAEKQVRTHLFFSRNWLSDRATFLLLSLHTFSSPPPSPPAIYVPCVLFSRKDTTLVCWRTVVDQMARALRRSRTTAAALNMLGPPLPLTRPRKPLMELRSQRNLGTVANGASSGCRSGPRHHRRRSWRGSRRYPSL
ncbi:hypothetical protein BGW80DRAFT_883622 [Lactifluus volemus]|nr:hypothetical protein BGW80DRAFT_883622 [Lactifluus volemus]